MGLSAGDQVDDRYALEERLGRGGQAEVWRARDQLPPGKQCAVKLVAVAEASPAHLERMRREARQLVELKHVSLVECFRLFEDLRRQLLGIVMELVDGQPLDDLIDDPRLDSHHRGLILAHIAGALAYVHQRGVVHRDIKPNNILVTRAFWSTPDDPAGVKLIDFGIAAQRANVAPLTQLGHVIGTTPYLAPEQLEPELWAGSGKPAATADVFAFGVLAWQLLAKSASAHPSGLSPSAGLKDYALAYRRARDERWPVAEPDPRWRAFFVRALALQPEARLQNGLALLEAISAVEPGLALRTAEDAVPSPLLGSPATPTRTPTASSSAAPSLAGGSTEPTGSQRPRSTDPGMPSPHIFAASPGGRSHAPTTSSGTSIPPTAPRGSGSSSVLWFVLGGVLLVLGAMGVGALMVGGRELGLFEKSVSSSSPAPFPVPTTTKTVEAPTPTVPTPAPPPKRLDDPTLPSWCDRSDSLCTCCPSGRSCGPGSCGDALRPGERFALRLWTVQARGGATPPLVTDPTVRVCVRRAAVSERTVCTRLRETLGGRMTPALAVTTEDLTQGGLAITVDGSDWRRFHVAKHSRGIHRSALCSGISFGGFDATEFELVHFYLDDPANPPAEHVCQSSTGPLDVNPKDRGLVDARGGREWGDRCWNYLKSGYYGWARAACDKALEMDPESPYPRASILYNTAIAEQARGNNDSARRYYGQSLAIRQVTEVQTALNSLDVR